MSRRDFFQLFCMFYLRLINRKCSKEKNYPYLTLYQNWYRTPVYSELAVSASPGRYLLKINFFIESALKMIQFKIQFKTKSGIFIQKNIYSIESRIFNEIIHSKKMRKIIQNSKRRPNMAFEPSWGPYIGNRPPEMDWNRSH